jgi:hypothetical protein
MGENKKSYVIITKVYKGLSLSMEGTKEVWIIVIEYISVDSQLILLFIIFKGKTIQST